MGGTLTVSLHLEDLSDGTDAIDDGTLIELLRSHRNKLVCQFIEDENDNDS